VRPQARFLQVKEKRHTGPEPTSVNIAVTGGNLYPARCCCLLLSNCWFDDNPPGIQIGIIGRLTNKTHQLRGTGGQGFSFGGFFSFSSSAFALGLSGCMERDFS
jgi:hypothetical protein